MSFNYSPSFSQFFQAVYWFTMVAALKWSYVWTPSCSAHTNAIFTVLCKNPLQSVVRLSTQLMPSSPRQRNNFFSKVWIFMMRWLWGFWFRRSHQDSWICRKNSIVSQTGISKDPIQVRCELQTSMSIYLSSAPLKIPATILEKC